MSEVEDKTQSLLAALWIKNRPVIEERLAVLEQASAAAPGQLSEQLRKDAGSAAHKLAGALGMYGYDEGTNIARQLEILLGNAVPEAGRLHTLVRDLRGSIFPNG